MNVGNIGNSYATYKNTEVKSSYEELDEKKHDKDTPPVDTKGLLDSDSPACYDRSILQPEHRAELLERMLSSMSKAESSEKIVEYDESIGREIYAFSIYDGKVHVSGNEGFEHKAMAYEKLINASLNKSWNFLFNGSIVNETKLIDTVDGILKYYMNLDNAYKKDNKTDSITNHVNDAFLKWCEDHKQKEYHIDGRV